MKKSFIAASAAKEKELGIVEDWVPSGMKKKKPLLIQRGSLTLIEVIAALAIVTIGLAAVFAIIYVGRMSFYTNSTKIELFQNARQGLRFMEEELLQTRTSSISIPPDSNYYNSLTFKIPQSIDEGGIITWSGDIAYSLSGNQIIRTQGGQARTIASQISNLRFRIDSGLPKIMEIYVTALKNNPFGEDFSIDLETSVKLRN